MKTFRYILRYKIDPFYGAEERIAELLEYCRVSNTEEVMLFTFAEELSVGHPTRQQLVPYIEMAKELKVQLEGIGVQLSLNPWTTLYQVSRGRVLQEGQNFTRMVGDNGVINPLVACPLCKNWQQYLCDTFAWMASEVGPTAIWIEDDWRLHNHDKEMGWGGCFCEHHLERFAEMVGEPVTRESVLDNILKPGKPHPWRNKWLELSRLSLLEPAHALKSAVQKAAPQVKLALMSSWPEFHSCEGRDWNALAEAFGNKPSFMIRPHMPPYTQLTAISAVPAITRATLACLDGSVDAYPELENSPRAGQYSKSAAYSLWQTFYAAAIGSRGITINHFDMMGCGIALDPKFGPAFGKAKSRLNTLAQLDLDDRNGRGPTILFTPRSAEVRNAPPDQGIRAIMDRGCQTWGKTLSILGLAHHYQKLEQPLGEGPFFIGDQLLRAATDEQIRHILSKTSFMDAYSAEILLERGYAPEIGIRACRWHTLEEKGFGYEQIRATDSPLLGLISPRMTAQRCADKLLEMEPDTDDIVLSDICRYDHRPLFPGMIQKKTSSGGTLHIMAYPFDGLAQFFMSYFNRFRCNWIQSLLFRNNPNNAPIVAASEDHPLHIYHLPVSKGNFIAIFNPCDDACDNIPLRISGLNIGQSHIQYLTGSGEWDDARFTLESDHVSPILNLHHNLKYLEGLFLLVKE